MTPERASVETLNTLFPDVANLPAALPADQPAKTTPRRRGDGRIFQREGSAHWWIAYYRRGKQVRESTHTADQRKAEKILKRRLAEVAAEQMGARPFVGPAQERIFVAALLDALERNYSLNAGHAPAQFKAHLQPIRDAFGDHRAVAVTLEKIDRYIEGRLADGYAPATVNRETQLLGQAFRLAQRGALGDALRLSFAPHIRKLPEDNVREGFFDPAQVEAVIGHLPAYLQDFVRFGYLTGVRKGRLAGMRWSDVDWEAGLLHLHRAEARNKRGTTIPLQGEIGEVITRQWAARFTPGPDGRRVPSPTVFHRKGKPIGDFRHAWQTACTAAGLGQVGADGTWEGPIFHDTRRSAVRNMVRAGVPQDVARKISGHRTQATFSRYNITDGNDIREAMAKTQAYLAGQAAAPPSALPAGAPPQNGDSSSTVDRAD